VRDGGPPAPFAPLSRVVFCAKLVREEESAMTDPSRLIADVRGLVRAILDANVGKNKLAGKLSKDKATISRWEDGSSLPTDPRDVAWLIRVALDAGIDIARYQIFDPIYDFSQHLTYEQKAENGPPDLGWITQVRRPPKVDWDVRGIAVNCPVGIASSPLVGDERWTALMLDLGFGLSTFKTRRTGFKRSWDAPQIAFVKHPPDLTNYDPGDPPEVEVTLDRGPSLGVIPSIVNSIGVPSDSATEWKQTYQRIQRLEGGHTVGVSVMGDGNTQEEIARDLAAAVAEARELEPPFIEVNASCPNLEKKGHSADVAYVKALAAAAQSALAGTATQLFVKLPFIPPLLIKSFFREIGPLVNTIVLRNSIRVRPVRLDRDGNKIPAFPNRIYGGLSGPCTFEATRRSIEAAVAAREQLGLDFGLIAVGGMSTVREIVDILNLGVDGVQVVTAPIFDPLLAWKVRFHMDRSVAATPKLRGQVEFEALLLPRDETEQLCFKNAQTAAAIVQRKTSESISVMAFTSSWNEWLQERPAIRPGAAQRVPGARSVDDWIRVFLR
jgi:dihydroorotate dehydrogenase (NAD+) catalytic subunit